MSADSAALVELQSRIAFYEDTTAQLNDALIAQQRRIDALERQVNSLAGRLREIVNMPDAPDDETPPHY